MDVIFEVATKNRASIIGELVIELTQEICERTHVEHFNIDLDGTINQCEQLLNDGHYAAIIGFSGDIAVAVATISETYALYAGGKIGVIQEFYVAPNARSLGVGAELIEQVKTYGEKKCWSCIELCTPPLPEFERTVSFYQENGLIPVGGRKMRQNIKGNR